MRTRISLSIVTIALLTLLGLTTPAEAAFPGVNGRIVFARFAGANEVDLWTMNPDGSDQAQLTFSGQDYDPEYPKVWSAGTEMTSVRSLGRMRCLSTL
ncbi:MAG: hypothetical protein ACKOB8_03260 [Mycobacterium sp.]